MGTTRESGLKNYNFRTLTENAIARLNAARQEEIDYYNQIAEQNRKAAVVAQKQGQVAADAATGNLHPLDDPNSVISQHLKKLGLTSETYGQMDVYRRQKDVVDPLIDAQWRQALGINPNLARLPKAEFDRTKQAFYNERRNIYDANYDGLREAETWTDKLGNIAADTAQGITGLVGNIGHLADVVSQDNIVARGLRTVGEVGNKTFQDMKSEGEQAREAALGHYGQTGQWGKFAGALGDSPLELLGDVGNTVAGFGGFGKLASGAGALVKAHNAGKALGGSVFAYSAVQGGGQTAEALKAKGIDVDSAAGRMAVATSALGNGLVALATPANAEKSLLKYFADKGVSPKMGKEAAEKVLAEMQKGGFFKSGTRLAGNAAKVGTMEYTEEAGQEGVSQAAVEMVGKDGSFNINNARNADALQRIQNKAIAGGIMGAVVGGGIGTGTNLGRHGSVSMRQKEAQARHELAEIKAEEQRIANLGLNDVAEFHGDGTFSAKPGLSEAELARYAELEQQHQEEEQAREAAESEAKQQRQAEEQAQFDAWWAAQYEKDAAQQQALADAQAAMTREQERQKRLAEYGNFGDEAQSGQANAVSEVQSHIQTATDAVVKARLAQDPTFDEQAFRDTVRGAGFNAWHLLSTQAQVTPDQDVKDLVATLQHASGKIIKDNDKAFKNRVTGADNFSLTHDERTKLAEALSVATGTVVQPADIGTTIDNNLTLLPEYDGIANLSSAISRARKDNNGFVVDSLHKAIMGKKAELDAAQKAQQQAQQAAQQAAQAAQQNQPAAPTAAQLKQQARANQVAALNSTEKNAVAMDSVISTLLQDVNATAKLVAAVQKAKTTDPSLIPAMLIQALNAPTSPFQGRGMSSTTSKDRARLEGAIRNIEQLLNDAAQTGAIGQPVSVPNITPPAQGNGVNNTQGNPSASPNAKANAKGSAQGSPASANQNTAGTQANQGGQQSPTVALPFVLNGQPLFSQHLRSWFDGVIDTHKHLAHEKGSYNATIYTMPTRYHSQMLKLLLNRNKTITVAGMKTSVNTAFGHTMELLHDVGIVATPFGSLAVEAHARKAEFEDIVKQADEYLMNNPVVRGNQMPLDVQMGRIAAYFIKTSVTAALAIPKVKPNTASPLRDTTVDYMHADINNAVMGAGLEPTIAGDGKASTILGSIASFYKKGSISARVINRLRQIAIDNDVTIDIMPRGEMEQRFGVGTKGVYDNANGKIYIREGMSFTDQARTILHEVTHAYFNRSAYAYHNFVRAAALDPQADPTNFGLTREEVVMLEQMAAVMRSVHGSPEYNNPRYNIARVTNPDGTTTAYGTSFDPTSPDALAEFTAEMFSNNEFRRATAAVIAKEGKTNLHTGQTRVRRFLNKVAEFLGFKRKTDNDAVTQFIENGMALLNTAPFTIEDGGVSRLASNKKDANQFAYDIKHGVQSYTLGYQTALEVNGNELAGGSAIRNLDTGLWSLVYFDRTLNEFVRKDDLDETQLAEEIVKGGLKIKARNSRTQMSQHIDRQIGRIHALYPTWARWLMSFRNFLTSYMSQEKADTTVDWIVGAMLKFEHNTQDRDAMYTWVTRMTQVLNENNPQAAQDLQREVQRLRAEANSEFVERGIDKLRMKDHMDKVTEFAKKFGLDDQKLAQMVYALEAQNRAAQFKQTPGGVNPYTGQPLRSSNKVSGFVIKAGTRPGITVDTKDDDGSIYMSTLTTQEQVMVEEFRRMWIAQNNTLLDIEYAAGAISDVAYAQMYGKFYAPLKTEGDIVTAFTKFATGRSTEAENPFTNYYAHAEARRAYALRQQELQLLVKAAQDNSLNNIISVNQTHYAHKRDDLGFQWHAPNLQDGSAWGVYIDGARHTITINDPTMREIYQKANSWEQRSTFWKSVAGITRGLSAVRTALSPAFLLASFPRDILTAMVNVQAAFRTTGGQVVTDQEAGQLAFKVAGRAVSSVGGILRGKWSGKRQWEYDVFKRLGGGLVMNARQDSEDYNRYFQQSLLSTPTTMRQAGLNKAKTGYARILDISHALEDSVRFATFMEFVEMRAGRKFNDENDLVSYLSQNPEIRTQAISGSKHVTGNFEVKGDNVALRSSYMFFNASMVGARNAVHMFNPAHGGHAIKAMKIIAGLSLASLAMMDAEMGDDDDGKSKSSRVSATENGICFGMAGCIQMPHETRWITAGMKAAYEFSKGDIGLGKAVAMQMRGLAQMGSPFAFGDLSGDDTGAGLAMGLVPMLLGLPVQLLSNTNSFGKDITPEFAYDSNGKRVMNAMEWQKSKLSDPEWTKWLAMNGQSMLGLDISSSQIDHTAQFFLGSLYSLGKKLIRGANNGDDAMTIFASTMGGAFIPRYDDSAITTELKSKMSVLKSSLQMGDSTQNMIRSTDELKTDARYRKFLAIEKEYERRVRNLSYNGDTYAGLIRKKQEASLTGDYNAIIGANRGLDLLKQQRSQLAAQIGELLKELE